MALKPGPGHRRIPCPQCGRYPIDMALASSALRCRDLKWERDGFSGGQCTFTTRDYDSIPLNAGEVLVIRDFTPFAFTRQERQGAP